MQENEKSELSCCNLEIIIKKQKKCSPASKLPRNLRENYNVKYDEQ